MAQNPIRRVRLENRLANASRRSIRDAMPQLAGWWQANTWLGRNNVYRQDAIRQIASGVVTDHIQLAEYVAASAVAHSFDGWSYLGRALEAEMAGDPDAARHLGYYAELRAGMALLASGGIGVFDRKHVVVRSNQQCEVFNSDGTHVFVWRALRIWAESAAGRDTILDSVSPGGVRLSEWLNQFSIGSNFLATSWMTQWGLDLSRLAEDRTARNIASYRPTAFTTPGPRSIEDTLRGILLLWEVCDPGANGGFPVLDSHLLRSSLEMAWRGSNAARHINSYQQQLQVVLNAVTPTSCPEGQWDQFLAFQNLDKGHGLIQDANGNVDQYHKEHSKQVLARATLLLRISTGCSAILLGEAGVNGGSDLEFWKSGASVRRRLWPDADPVASSIDLWLDVESASESIDQWLHRVAEDPPLSCHALWTEQAAAAATLATAERAFLWGIGL